MYYYTVLLHMGESVIHVLVYGCACVCVSQGSQSEAVLQCFVLGMEEPLSLQLSAEVYGLSVLYHVTQAPG